MEGLASSGPGGHGENGASCGGEICGSSLVEILNEVPESLGGEVLFSVDVLVGGSFASAPVGRFRGSIAIRAALARRGWIRRRDLFRRFPFRCEQESIGGHPDREGSDGNKQDSGFGRHERRWVSMSLRLTEGHLVLPDLGETALGQLSKFHDLCGMLHA